MKYEIVLNDITYTVTAYNDGGAIFANIHSVSGLDHFGADELPELFNEETHQVLTAALRRMLLNEETHQTQTAVLRRIMNGQSS